MHSSWVYSEAGFLVLTTSLSSMVPSNIEFCEADQKLAVVSPNFTLESAPGSARLRVDSLSKRDSPVSQRPVRFGSRRDIDGVLGARLWPVAALAEFGRQSTRASRSSAAARAWPALKLEGESKFTLAHPFLLVFDGQFWPTSDPRTLGPPTPMPLRCCGALPLRRRNDATEKLRRHARF